MTVLRGFLLALAVFGVALAPTGALAQSSIKSVWVPPSRVPGLDMMILEEEAMPQEPELAEAPPEFEDISWSGAPIDMIKPVHHLYTDLRRQLESYQRTWSSLPQVRVPSAGGALKLGATGPRVAILRKRLGAAPGDKFDEALKSRLAAYQRAHGLDGDGVGGSETLASLNRGAAHHERLVLLSMERVKRLPAEGKKYILVDAGSAKLWMYENGRPVGSMNVVVGAASSETPMMAAAIRYANVNPYWNVPPDLVAKLIAPRVLAEGPAYLKARGYQVLDSWDDDPRVVDPSSVDWKAVADGLREARVRQLPGPTNSMGEIKFMMPNEYGIYLHDTPNKALFGEANRWVSNGCVRVEDARRLARWIFGEMPRAPEARHDFRVELEQPVPVYITYLTVGAQPELSFRPDPYERNAPVLARDADLVELLSLAPVASKPERAALKANSDPGVAGKKAAVSKAGAASMPGATTKFLASTPAASKPARSALSAHASERQAHATAPTRQTQAAGARLKK
jgi:L,D-transpeptidase YcbB